MPLWFKILAGEFLVSCLIGMLIEKSKQQKFINITAIIMLVSFLVLMIIGMKYKVIFGR